MSKPRYIGAIDGLRSLAVILVFAVHTYPGAIPGGFIGVDIFFVISGFLITSILLDEIEATGTLSLVSFYRRRALRILPASLFCVAAIYLFLPGLIEINGESASLNAVASALSFMNWLRAFTDITGGALGHFWSLAIEEQFYALWSLVMLVFIAARKPVYIALAAFAILIASLAWSVYLGLIGTDPDRIYNGLDTHACGLLLGCILAGIPKGPFIARVSRLWPLIVLAAALQVAFFDVNSRWLWLYIPACSFTGLLLVICALDEQSLFAKTMSSKGARWLGKRSYSFYLWHMPVVSLFFHSGVSRSLWFLPSFLICLILAALSYRIIERPFLKLKDRHSPEPTRACPG